MDFIDYCEELPYHLTNDILLNIDPDNRDVIKHFSIGNIFNHDLFIKKYDNHHRIRIEETQEVIGSKIILTRTRFQRDLKHGNEELYENFCSCCRLIMSTPYKHGMKDGVEEGFDHNTRQKLWIQTWKNNYLNGDRIKYTNGIIESIIRCKDGKRHGKEEHWYPNGELKCTKFWINHILHGQEINYYKNGHISHIISWNHGNKIGSELKYDETGRVYLTISWLDGNKFGDEVLYDETGCVKTIIRWDGNGSHTIYHR